jgi:hypothetical protein
MCTIRASETSGAVKLVSADVTEKGVFRAVNLFVERPSSKRSDLGEATRDDAAPSFRGSSKI